MAPQSAESRNTRQIPVPDRRRWTRVAATDLSSVKAELTSGAEVWLVDISQGGARFRTRTRMLPGLGVTLKFITPTGDTVVHGRIVRSAFVNMNNGLPGYEVGVAFDQVLSGPIAEATARAEELQAGRSDH